MSSDIVQLHLPHENSHLAPDRQRALCKAVAKICDIKIDDVLIVTQKQEHGLWVAIGVPKQLTFRLTGASGQAGSPLWSAFQNAQLSLIPLHQPSERFDRLQSEDEILLRLLYLGAKQVIIRSELGGGYSGARVLLTEPIDQHNRAMASQIVKLASAEEIAIEQEQYTRYVENYLPRITPRLKNRQIWEGKAGLCYDFVDGGVLGRTKTFENFYKSQAVEPIIQTLRDLMVKEIGEQWYRQATPLTTTFAAEYGPNLVEHLLIRIRPSSPDGIWRRGQEPTIEIPYKRIDSDEILSRYAEAVAGTLIQINGLAIQEIKVDTLRLHHLEKPGTVVKVSYGLNTEQASALAVGENIVVRGEVVHNRQVRLENIVFDAFSNYERFDLEKKALKLDTVQWSSRELAYPNPLYHYTQVLNSMLRARKSLVHGDLHLRNILVDETGRSYLIDFALISERHNLFDFIKLETYIRQMILSRSEHQFSFRDYLQFEEQLTLNSLTGAAVMPLDHTELRKAYEVITALRKLAGLRMEQPPDWHGEYLPALFLYNLVVLKYHENQGRQATRLAFGTAAVLLKYMQDFSIASSPELGAKKTVDEPKSETQVTRRYHDPYTYLEIGTETLLNRLDKAAPEYDQALALQLLLQQNLQRTRTFLENPLLGGERAEITAQLNRIARSTLGIPFRDLCPKS